MIFVRINICSCAYLPLYILFGEVLVQVFCPLKNWFVLKLIDTVKRILVIRGEGVGGEQSGQRKSDTCMVTEGN